MLASLIGIAYRIELNYGNYSIGLQFHNSLHNMVDQNRHFETLNPSSWKGESYNPNVLAYIHSKLYYYFVWGCAVGAKEGEMGQERGGSEPSQ